MIGSLLTGKALKWFTPILEKPELNNEVLNNYAEFTKLLESTFGEPDRALVAASAIRKLKQGSQSAASYASEFRQLVADLDWNDNALMDQFRIGLNEDVKDMMLHFEQPKSLEEMIKIATKVDTRLFERRQERRGLANTNHRSNFPVKYDSKQPGKPSIAQTSGTPMELDAMKRGPLSEQEKKRRRENNLCLYCGSGQHLRANCPLAKPRNASLNKMSIQDQGNSNCQ
jgi:hypothetical protein